MTNAHRHPSGRPPRATLRSARWPDDLDMIRGHFRDYRQWVADHQDPAPAAKPRVEAGLALLDRLVAELPGAYGPPHGDILLWFEEGQLVACGALRGIGPKVAEGKRLFVRPDYRGTAFGVPFARALMEQARALGYERLKVDTLPSMKAAIEFYQEVGFRPTAAFWPHPVTDALYFECDLRE